MPITVWLMSLILPTIAGPSSQPVPPNSLLLLGIFVAAGMTLGQLIRMALDEVIGPRTALADRLAGARSAQAKSAWSRSRWS